MKNTSGICFRNMFSEKNDKFSAKRAELAERFEHGELLTGPDGLRRELAAFDLSYFGRAYLPHYFLPEIPGIP